MTDTEMEKKPMRVNTGTAEQDLQQALVLFWRNHMARIKEARLERGEK